MLLLYCLFLLRLLLLLLPVAPAVDIPDAYWSDDLKALREAVDTERSDNDGKVGDESTRKGVGVVEVTAVVFEWEVGLIARSSHSTAMTIPPSTYDW